MIGSFNIRGRFRESWGETGRDPNELLSFELLFLLLFFFSVGLIEWIRNIKVKKTK